MKSDEQHYLAHKLQQIIFVQSMIQEPDWITKLFLIKSVKDTIPFLLYLNSGETFNAYGNIGKRKGGECFTTPFFRIEELRDGYATFMLLKPIFRPTSDEQQICDVINLEKTPFCIEIDLKMFGGIQFLSPELVC